MQKQASLRKFTLKRTFTSWLLLLYEMTTNNITLTDKLIMIGKSCKRAKVS